MKIKKYRYNTIIQFGGNGVHNENYMFRMAFHHTSPHFRICIQFNTDKLIKFFGFNQKDINLF